MYYIIAMHSINLTLVIIITNGICRFPTKAYREYSVVEKLVNIFVRLVLNRCKTINKTNKLTYTYITRIGLIFPFQFY